MKKIIIPILIAVFAVSVLAATPADAGSKQRHRWEGVAIGMGAAILGSVLLDNMVDHHPPPPRYDKYYKHHRPHRPHKYGHWEIKRRYIPPRYERVWNPGHYNRYGDWIPGRWMNIEKRPGHWIEEKVWVAHR